MPMFQSETCKKQNKEGSTEVKTIRAHHIQYDTDGHRIPGLKKELILEVDDDLNPEYDLADVISDKTGWCVVGFLWEEVKKPETIEIGG